MVGNFINWWIGAIIMYFYIYIGNILSIIGLWSIGNTGVIDQVTAWKMPGISDTYLKPMKMGI